MPGDGDSNRRFTFITFQLHGAAYVNCKVVSFICNAMIHSSARRGNQTCKQTPKIVCDKKKKAKDLIGLVSIKNIWPQNTASFVYILSVNKTFVAWPKGWVL